MSDIDVAVRWSKRLETLLEKGYGATGRGLHEKLDAVQDRLPGGTVRKLRFIATVRNKIVHEADYERIEDRVGFERTCTAVEAELASAAGPDTAVTAGTGRTWDRGTPRRDGQGRGKSRGASGTSRSRRLRRLSPWFAVVGAIAGGVAVAIQGAGIVYSVLGVLLGAVGGYYWLGIVRLAALACATAALVWAIVRAYEFLYPAG